MKNTFLFLISFVIVFLAVYVITVGDALSYYFTIVKKDRIQSILWGFISWVLTAVVFLFILKTEDPVVYIVFGALGGAFGNLMSIQVIKSYRRMIKTVVKFFRRRRRKKR